MLRREIAEKLIASPNEVERSRILEQNRNFADARLAVILKEICYEFWTTKPTTAQSAARALKSLVKINRAPQIAAFAFWVSGIADLTGGKLESAVKNLAESSEIFKSINLEHDAAHTQVAKLIPLALLGRYDEAIENGQHALKIFEKNNDRLAAAKILMNLGNIVSRRENHRAAEKYYLAAQRRFRDLGELSWLAMAENGLAMTYAALNDFRRAEKFYARALAQAKHAEKIVTVAEIEASIGNLSFFRGKFDRALQFLENSRRKYADLQMPHQTAVAELEIADLYLELNLADEAFEIYEKTVESLKKLKLQGEEARARANFGKAALLKNELAKAKRELKKSARLYELEKNSNGAAAVKLTEANLEFSRRNFTETLKILDQTDEFLKLTENSRLKISADWLRGETLRLNGNLPRAERILAANYSQAVKNEQLSSAQICLNSLGNISLQNKDSSAAEKYFKRAVKIIETMRAPLPAEEFRISFLADKLASYSSLTKIYLARNEIQKAFLANESSRARTLFESLTLAKSDNENSPQMVRQLADLREELNWFYSRSNHADTAETNNFEREITAREKKIAEISRQIDSTKTTDQIGKRADLNVKLLHRQLGDQKILIEFVCLENVFSAFVISDKNIKFVADLAKQTEIVKLLENLHFQFGALRLGKKLPDNFALELKKRADFYLRELYQLILKPLETLVGTRNLIFVPTDVLQYVPFQALFDGEKYVVENREVTVSPSAAVWQFLNKKTVKSGRRALLFGFADEKIPLVDGEIKMLENIFENSQVFSGASATFENFTKNSGGCDVLHLACHGQFRPDNPLFSSLHLADGWITVRDLCAQKIDAELVTLSACETGLSKLSAGDEILGLARGFLSAGANSLILSLWTVNDQAAAELMKDFYSNLQRGASISASLRFSQINFIKRGTHPYFWSPFVLLGR